MAQNKAHLGDIVSITVGDLKGQQGTVIALRLTDNHCLVTIPQENDPTKHNDYDYAGHEIELIECKHQGVILSE